MDRKVTGIVAYLGWIGLLIAFLAGDKEGAKFHLNQALVLLITSIICGVVFIIPLLGWIVGAVGCVFVFVCMIMGIVAAANEQEKELPLIGKFRILK
ncbi:MAG: DUF4870 domain-containing protein [Lachnospiraceae bacterium]|nr:DUF4870 domain-containing protein [Lachnospiraceae bacterium]